MLEWSPKVLDEILLESEQDPDMDSQLARGCRMLAGALTNGGIFPPPVSWWHLEGVPDEGVSFEDKEKMHDG